MYVNNDWSKRSGCFVTIGSQDIFFIGGFDFDVRRFDSFTVEAFPQIVEI